MSKYGVTVKTIARFVLGDIEFTSLSDREISLMTLLALHMQKSHNNSEVQVIFRESMLIIYQLFCRKKQKTSRLGCSHIETVGEMSYCKDCFEVRSS